MNLEEEHKLKEESNYILHTPSPEDSLPGPTLTEM